MAWSYDPASHRYRNDETGRYLSAAQQIDLRDAFTDARKGAVQGMAGQLVSGELTLGQWETAVRGEIRTVFVDLAALGRGGRNMMEPADWGRVGSQVKAQYGFLSGFSREIAAGELSEAQVAARSGLYVESGTQAYERARATSFGAPDLPEYPGDGNQICGANCRCSWELVETEGGLEATWVVAGDEASCESCVGNGERWSPLVLAREEGAVAA